MELSAEGDTVPRKQRLAEKLYELAMAGNVSAIEYIVNRLDGKPTQAIAFADQPGKALLCAPRTDQTAWQDGAWWDAPWW